MYILAADLAEAAVVWLLPQEGLTPLHAAVGADCVPCTHALLDAGANKEAKDKARPSRAALELSRPYRRGIDRGADKNSSLIILLAPGHAEREDAARVCCISRRFKDSDVARRQRRRQDRQR